MADCAAGAGEGGEWLGVYEHRYMCTCVPVSRKVELSLS